ncbi:hypothetical protein MPER_11905 [Moniliophthora perniciosa FA553]|nr:hypothetical protein MPER_11905 [Moniliophthora perniciosa FA553]
MSDKGLWYQRPAAHRTQTRTTILTRMDPTTTLTPTDPRTTTTAMEAPSTRLPAARATQARSRGAGLERFAKQSRVKGRQLRTDLKEVYHILETL